MRRQSQAAAAAYAGPSTGVQQQTFLRTTSGNNVYSPGGVNIDQSSVRATSGTAVGRNMSGAGAGVARGAQRATVQIRPNVPRQVADRSNQGVERSITEQAELGLEELEPAVFGMGAGQTSVRARPMSGIAGTARVGVNFADPITRGSTIAEVEGS